MLTLQTKLFILILVTFTFSCKDKDQSSEVSEDLSAGKKIYIDSKILSEEREIWVHVPDDEGDSVRYPVLYLMDGDAHFYSVVGLMHQFSSVNGNDICPKMIVVGIRNTDRTRDLTPTRVEPKDSTQNWSKTSGGGEKFTDFIEQELIPHIEKNYPATKERVLIGHSLGGLMVINTLVKRPELFAKFISIDPSLSWDDQKALKEFEEALENKHYKGKGLFVGIANTIGIDTLMAMADTTTSTSHFRSIIHFVKTLKETRSNGLDWMAKYYENDSHSSVPLICELDAFHYLFRKVPVEMDLAQLKRFEGKFRNKTNTLEVKANEKELLVTGSWDGKSYHFMPVSENSIYSFKDMVTLKYVGDGNGGFKDIVAFDEVYAKIPAD